MIFAEGTARCWVEDEGTVSSSRSWGSAWRDRELTLSKYSPQKLERKMIENNLEMSPFFVLKHGLRRIVYGAEAMISGLLIIVEAVCIAPIWCAYKAKGIPFPMVKAGDIEG